MVEENEFRVFLQLSFVLSERSVKQQYGVIVSTEVFWTRTVNWRTLGCPLILFVQSNEVTSQNLCTL
jgi:hypothetical protein